MSALDRLLGTWEFTMHHSAMSEPVTGRQRYERALDGAFVLQHWTSYHPDFPDAMALLSDDRYHYFDVRGITRVFELISRRCRMVDDPPGRGLLTALRRTFPRAGRHGVNRGGVPR